MSKALERKLKRLAAVGPGVLRKADLATGLRAVFYLIDDWGLRKVALLAVSVSYRVAEAWGPSADHAAFVGKAGAVKWLLDPVGGIYSEAGAPFIGDWSLVVPRPSGEAIRYQPRPGSEGSPDLGAAPVAATHLLRQLRDAMEGLRAWGELDNAPDSSSDLGPDDSGGWPLNDDDRPTSPDSPWAIEQGRRDK